MNEPTRCTGAPAALDEGQPEPVLDLEHLLSFTDGDPQLEGELLSLYLSSADVYLAAMTDALRTGASWRSPVHALKGASGNLGARRVMTLAQAAEHAPPSRTRLSALHRAVDEVRGLARNRAV